MGQAISQGNTTQGLPFLMVQSADHITGATGVTPTVLLAKNGGAFAAPSGTVSEIGAGWYQLSAAPLDASTLGPLLLHATAGGCDPRDSEFSVVNYNPSVVLPTSPPILATFGTVTARMLIDQALDDLGIYAVGEALSADDAQDALRRLNAMMDGWALQPGTMLNEAREVFPLTAGRGGPNSPYLIGPGAVFDTVRPTYVSGFKLLLTTVAPPIELWLDALTDQAYRAIAMKTFSAIYPTVAYFNETFPWATLYLYPVPTTGANSLVMYSLKATAGFASLTTPVALAPGYAEAIHYNLARRLAAPFSQPWTPQLDDLARSALSWVKTANTKLLDLALDPALTFGARKPWNILTDA